MKEEKYRRNGINSQASGIPSGLRLINIIAPVNEKANLEVLFCLTVLRTVSVGMTVVDIDNCADRTNLGAILP